MVAVFVRVRLAQPVSDAASKRVRAIDRTFIATLRALPN
jgi:hypothetical protein